jgi:hypothetical protein
MAQRQFSHHLGQCNAYLAELWGVFGLKLAYDRGFKKLRCTLDGCLLWIEKLRFVTLIANQMFVLNC